MFKAELLTGDFSENTMTFEIKGEMTLQAGDYVIFTKEEYEKLKLEENLNKFKEY